MFSVVATHRTHLPAGAPRELRALVCVTAVQVDAHSVDASLRLWTPFGATVVELRERAPARCDLGERAIALDERTMEYATGPWTDTAREYELTIALPAGAAGDDMLAARVAVVVDGATAGRTSIAVSWTDDQALLAASSAPPDAADAIADLPTGASPEPRHTLAADGPGAVRCAACGLRPADGDRFCERCGQALADAQKS